MITSTKEFFYLYTRGLNQREIEQLLKKDAVGAYTYLRGKTNLQSKKASMNQAKCSSATLIQSCKALSNPTNSRTMPPWWRSRLSKESWPSFRPIGLKALLPAPLPACRAYRPEGRATARREGGPGFQC